MNETIFNPYYEEQYWWKFANVLSFLDDHSILLERDFVQFTRKSLIDTNENFYDFKSVLSDSNPFMKSIF